MHSNPSRSRPHSPDEHDERKRTILTQGRPTTAQSVANAVVIKDDALFFLTAPGGDVPLRTGHGFGLYYHDCRYLNGYDMQVAGAAPDVLVATAANGFMGVFELANPDVKTPRDVLIPKEHVGIEWIRVIDAASLCLRDRIIVRNFSTERVELPLLLRFRAEFEDVYGVRGLVDEALGTLRAPAWNEGGLTLGYDGKDGVERLVLITFSRTPGITSGTSAEFPVTLAPQESAEIGLCVALSERKEGKAGKPPSRIQDPDMRTFRDVRAALDRANRHWLDRHTQVQSDSLMVNAVVKRSLQDLHMLRTALDDSRYIAAGVPWFVALFGRDSLITALETLAFDPRIARDTLRLLARYQGKTVDHYRDEEPGKVLHELRVGELARLNEIPHTPYYGSADATPLFLMLLSRYVGWTGDLGLFDTLKTPVELALAWMREYGDGNRDGYIEYTGRASHGLINQGWKDSGDAIVNEDGTLARPPIALIEVQAYAYAARIGIAGLYRRIGDAKRSDELLSEAAALRERFERDYWLPEKRCYALALQAGGAPVTVLSSNPGHALLAGIVAPHRARRMAELLMSEEMFSGWGVRTLATSERRYNPIGYHLGTVWPHDNALIAAGFREYGFDEQLLRIAKGIIEATMHFQHHRLPEVFAGFSREEYDVPVRYPSACHPQAWAAGAVPSLITTLLGLSPDACGRVLRVIRPMLPDYVQFVELRGLRVGDSRAHLRFERKGNRVHTTVLGVEGGKLDIMAEAACPAADDAEDC